MYDAEGNRVSKTGSGTTTHYLVDDLNPTRLVARLPRNSCPVTLGWALARLVVAQVVGEYRALDLEHPAAVTLRVKGQVLGGDFVLRLDFDFESHSSRERLDTTAIGGARPDAATSLVRSRRRLLVGSVLAHQGADHFFTKRLTAYAQRLGLDHQPVENSCHPMKNADDEFNARKAPLLAAISEEGLQIARVNHWPAVVIEMSGAGVAAAGRRGQVRCCLRNPQDARAIDEPSARLLDAAQTLHSLFAEAGTPFRSVTIDWVDDTGDGKVRRRCAYEYH